jgi:hypothetical protein
MTQHPIRFGENWQFLPAEWRCDKIKNRGRLRRAFDNQAQSLMYTSNMHANA